MHKNLFNNDASDNQPSFGKEGALIGESNRLEFCHYLKEAIRSYHRTEMPDVGLLGWYGRFVDRCTLSQFIVTFNNYVAEYDDSGTRNPYPTPADILSRIPERKLSDVEFSWKCSEYCAKHFGSSHQILFDDPVQIDAILAFGGWPSFCEKIEIDLIKTKRQFQINYEAKIQLSGTHASVSVLNGHLGADGPLVEVSKATDGRRGIVVNRVATNQKNTGSMYDSAANA